MKRGRPGLTDSEAKRVREALQQLLKAHTTAYIADQIGVEGSAVTQWKSKNKPSEANAREVFRLAGLPPDGWRDDSQSLSENEMQRLFRRLALATELLQLVPQEGELGQAMDGLTDEVRRAVLGVMHVLGYPLEEALKMAHRAMNKHPQADFSPETWFTLIRSEFHGRPPSGTLPTVRPLEIVKKKRRG